MADQDFKINVVTTANLSGIQQTGTALQNLSKQQLAQQQAVQAAAYEVGRALRIALGGAVIAGGYKFVSDLRAAAVSIEKLSAEMDKQGAQLVKNAQAMAELTKFATTNADVIKIAEGSLKSVEQTQKAMLDSAAEELTLWQKIQDVWAKGFRDTGPQAAALKLKQEMAAQNFEMARQHALQDITVAKFMEAKRAAQTYSETISELNQKIDEQEKLAATHLAQGDVQSYLSSASAAEKYKAQLQDVTNTRNKSVDDISKKIDAADPNVKAVLMNEQAAAAAEPGSRDQDLFQQSADQIKKSFSPEQQRQYTKIQGTEKKVGDQSEVIRILNELKDIWR